MRILLDECLSKKLKLQLTDHFVQTVPEAGWAGKQNCDLLRLAEKDFAVLLTTDQNMEHQQHRQKFDLAFIVLRASTNDIDDLRLLMPSVRDALTSIQSGDIS